MKIIETISSLRSRWFGKAETTQSKRERFVSGVIRTQAFSKLTIQEKLLSLGKLIMLFRKDNGYTPVCLQKKLESLNEQLSRETAKTWNSLYSN